MVSILSTKESSRRTNQKLNKHPITKNPQQLKRIAAYFDLDLPYYVELQHYRTTAVRRKLAISIDSTSLHPFSMNLVRSSIYQDSQYLLRFACQCQILYQRLCETVSRCQLGWLQQLFANV